jgi:hypothetical protein
MGGVKTTIELPDDLFRNAKATAARRGTALKQFVQEALQEKLEREKDSGGTQLAGSWPVPPPDVPIEELRRIHAIIEADSELIDYEDSE